MRQRHVFVDSSDPKLKAIASAVYEELMHEVAASCLAIAQATHEEQVTLALMIEVLLAHVINLYCNMHVALDLEWNEEIKKALMEKFSAVASAELQSIWHKSTGSDN